MKAKSERVMSQIALLIVVSILIQGCATAQLSKGPDTYALIEHQESAAFGIPKAMDERKGENAGTIGGALIKVKKKDLVELATNYLVQYINQKVGLNVVRITMSESEPAEVIMAKHNVDGIVVLKIKELKMFSMDALLQPVKTDLTLELMILDKSGRAIYERTVTGHDEKRIGVSMVEKSAGKIVETVVKDALSQLVKDPELRKIIARFKWGKLSKVLKIPFWG